MGDEDLIEDLGLSSDSEAMRAAIFRGLEGAYPADTWHTWQENMAGEYSGHVQEVIAGIRAAVKPLLIKEQA